MRILFNCINNVVGGGVQNAANFISFAANDPRHEFLFLVSPVVAQSLQDFDIRDKRVLIIEERTKLLAVQKTVRSIENDFKPDVIYTMAGPSFVAFKAMHVLGISDPYITHAKRYHYFMQRSFLSSCRFILLEVVKGLAGRLLSDYFVFQTQASMLGYNRRFFKTFARSTVVPNAIGTQFFESISAYQGWADNGQTKYILCPSACYPHKNIEVIFKVASLLRSSGLLHLRFILTIPTHDFEKFLAKYPMVEDIVSNNGPFSYVDALGLYEAADAVILPSLLETFSTVYIEAMALGLPLFVPKEDFSEDICEDYAIYYDSLSERSLFEVLLSPESIDQIQKKQAAQARILEKYGNQEQRYKKILDQIEAFISRRG